MPESALEKIIRLTNPKPGRQVDTPEGAKKYNKPIGADIGPGGVDAEALNSPAAGPKPGTKVTSIAELKSAPVGTRITIAGGIEMVKQKNGKWAQPGSKVMSAEIGFADKFSLKQGDVKWA